MNARISEFARYIINGLSATLIHYIVLIFNLEWLDIRSAGASNFIAAIFGVTASFLGNHYYVFRNVRGNMLYQGMKFFLFYGLIALLHGAILLIWSDWYGFDYRIGFLLATALQVVISYLGNKYIIFK